MHRQPCLFRFLLDLIGAAHEQLGRRRSRLDAAVGDRHHVKMVLRQAGAVVQRRAAGRVNEARAGGRHDRRRADAQHDLAADRTVEDLSVRHRDDHKAVRRAGARALVRRLRAVLLLKPFDVGVHLGTQLFRGRVRARGELFVHPGHELRQELFVEIAERHERIGRGARRPRRGDGDREDRQARKQERKEPCERVRSLFHDVPSFFISNDNVLFYFCARLIAQIIPLMEAKLILLSKPTPKIVLPLGHSN